MKLEQFEVYDQQALMTGKPFIGVRDGRRYLIHRLGWTDGHRTEQIKEALENAVMPGSNIAIPEYLRVGNELFSVDFCGREAVSACPSAAICALPQGFIRQIARSAAAALATLERAGIIHGNISCHSFQLNAAQNGTLYVQLTGLADAGIVGKLAPVRGNANEYTAPHLANQAVKTPFAEDVYALGMCLHLWFTGDLPVCDSVSDRQGWLLSDRLPRDLIPIVGMLLAPRSEHRPRASAVLRILQRESPVKTAWNYQCFHDFDYSVQYIRTVLECLKEEKKFLTL